MTDRKTALRDLGFAMSSAHSDNIFDVAISEHYGAVAFSGYGAFTPITVSSETTIADANLERDKSRD